MLLRLIKYFHTNIDLPATFGFGISEWKLQAVELNKEIRELESIILVRKHLILFRMEVFGTFSLILSSHIRAFHSKSYFIVRLPVKKCLNDYVTW